MSIQRIGIIGDVHSEHTLLAAALEHLQQENVDAILCTGDLTDGSGDLNACIKLLSHHNVLTVRGNHDRWVLENKARHIENAHHLKDLNDTTRTYLHNLPPYIEVETSYGCLLLCHGVLDQDLQKIWPGTERMPAERSPQLDRLIDQQKYSIMINGHVHYRTIIHFQSLLLINAGTLMRRHHPGFSMLDLYNQQIIGYEFEPNIHRVKTQSMMPCHNTDVFKNTQHFDGNWTPTTLYA